MFTSKVAIAFIALSMGGYTLSFDDNTQQPALKDLINANMAQTYIDEKKEYQQFLEALA